MFHRFVVATVVAASLLGAGDLNAIILSEDANPRVFGKAGETVEGVVHLTNAYEYPVKVIVGMEEKTTAYPAPIPEWLYFEQEEVVLKAKQVYALAYRMKILPRATGQLIKRVYFDESPVDEDHVPAEKEKLESTTAGLQINVRRSTYFVVTIAGTEHYSGTIRELSVEREGKTFDVTIQNSGNMYVKVAGRADLYEADTMVLLNTIVLNSGKRAILAKRLTDFKGTFREALRPGSYLLRVHFPFPDEENSVIRETTFTIAEPNGSGASPSSSSP